MQRTIPLSTFGFGNMIYFVSLVARNPERLGFRMCDMLMAVAVLVLFWFDFFK